MWKFLHFHTSLASVLPCQSTPMTTSTVQCVISTYYVPYGASGNTIDYYTRCFCAQFLSNRLHVSKWKIMLVIIYANTNCNDRRRRFFYISWVFFAFLQPKSTRFKRKKLKNLKIWKNLPPAVRQVEVFFLFPICRRPVWQCLQNTNCCTCALTTPQSVCLKAKQIARRSSGRISGVW